MANQKEYKIIIGGIKESIEGIGTLQDSLDRLGKKVEESGGHFQTASKGMDELAKTNQKIAEYNEEYATALAANKAVLADHNKEVKAKIDLEKAEITVQEGLTDTYAHKQQLLTALGKVIKNTTGDTSELKAQYATLNQELKDFDAELGNHQRNVGDYEIATKNLKAELKELTAQIASMLANGVDKADPALAKLIDRAGQLADAMADARQEINRSASDTRKFDDAINIAQSATAAFTLFKGAMSAFGVETEGAVEAIQKLQGAMGVLQSLQQLQDSLSQNSATARILTKSMNILTLGIKGTTTATKFLRIALASIGIGLIIGLVATLVEHWDDLKKVLKDTFPILNTISEKFNGLKGAIIGAGMAIKNGLMYPFEKLGKSFMKLIKGDFKGALSEMTSGWSGWLDAIKKGFWDGVAISRQTNKEKEDDNKETNNKIKVDTQKMLDDLVKAEKKAREDIQKIREEELQNEKKRLEKLKALRKNNSKAEQDWQKQYLKLQLAYAKTEEEKIRIKKQIIDLDEKIAEQEVKNAAADAMGISVEELQQRLDMTEGKWAGLNEEQKQVLQTLITQVDTIKMGAEEAMAALGGGSSASGSTGDSGNTQNPLAKFFDNNIVQGFVDATLDSIAVIGDAIADLYDMELEEMEEKLDQLAELHDEAVEKVNESQDKISDLNQKMKDSSGAQLEAYKQQMADEMLLLQQRQQEEKRVQKEKEKQEEAIKKKQKQARKDEMKVQLIESIVNTALAVTKTFSAYPMPFAAILGGIVSALGAIQQAIIIKQMSKLADGGLLSGPSHANGGIPVGNTGVEVEGGEYVVNKRSTAKYLPLLQSINEEGARHKTVANQIGKMADGGQLNYERINSNLDSLSTASIVASAIGGIDLHPVVSVVDINREQRNYTEVRQLAGANN